MPGITGRNLVIRDTSSLACLANVSRWHLSSLWIDFWRLWGSMARKKPTAVLVLCLQLTLNYPFIEAKLREKTFFLEEMMQHTLTKFINDYKMRRPVHMLIGQISVDFQSFDSNKLHRKICRITTCRINTNLFSEGHITRTLLGWQKKHSKVRWNHNKVNLWQFKSTSQCRDNCNTGFKDMITPVIFILAVRLTHQCCEWKQD